MDDWKRCLGVFAAAVLLLATPADARRVKRGGAKNPVRQAACVAECDTVRNLIYMIGDGMGLAHVTMLQIAEGYDNPVSFMRAENVALIKSYSRNNRVTDSAAAGTALATGHKTNNSMLGVLPDSTAVESMMAKAVRRGMATGLVVTCYLPHATPGAFYAHQVYRRTLEPIAEQLVESGVDVAPPIRSRRARSSGCSHPSTCLMHTRGAATIFPAPSGMRWRFCRTTLRSGTRASCSWSRGR